MSNEPDQTGSNERASNEFEKEMDIARRIMDERWVALRALALRDQYPDADVPSLMKMAEEQLRRRDTSSKT